MFVCHLLSIHVERQAVNFRVPSFSVDFQFALQCVLTDLFSGRFLKTLFQSAERPRKAAWKLCEEGDLPHHQSP